MSYVELLTVGERFEIGAIGLIVEPNFSVPRGQWNNFSATVVVAKPDGHRFEVAADFKLQHFNISDPKVPADNHWRVTVCLPNKKMTDVPIGAKIFVSHDVRDAVIIGNALSSLAKPNDENRL